MAIKFQKYVLALWAVVFLTSCLKKPVLHRENNLPVSKATVKETCAVLAAHFPDYSCAAYFEKTYEKVLGEEQVQIHLRREQLSLTYTTKHKNEDLFILYEQTLKQLDTR